MIALVMFLQANCPSKSNKTKSSLWDEILEKSRCGVRLRSTEIDRWHAIWHVRTAETYINRGQKKFSSRSP